MKSSESSQRAEEFTIDGMSCEHCRRAIDSALRKIPGLTVRQVAVGSASVEFDRVRVSRDQIVAAIQAAGYNVRT